MSIIDFADWTVRIRSGDRFALSKAITLVESHLDTDQPLASQLLKNCTAEMQDQYSCIAISGSPGVGKSTFIERLGMYLIGQEQKVAVLSIDPSSKRTHGSILGDKTRMNALSKHPKGFVRPSPNRGIAGGIGQATYAATLLCAAAGYSTILIETVGVGQSETIAKHLTDLFVVLIQPSSGDALQALKKGIIEEADLILINKSDPGKEAEAQVTKSQFESSLRLQKTSDQVPVHCCSALYDKGIEESWNLMQTLRSQKDLSMASDERALFWFEQTLQQLLLSKLPTLDPSAYENARSQIRGKDQTYLEAAQQLVEEIIDKCKGSKE